MPKTIAIVDDDDAVRDSVAALITSMGYLVSTYGSSAEFLEDVQRTKPDFIILDHQMRGMTGVELAERLAYERYHNTVVLISGNLSEALRSRAQRAGVAAILEKPFPDDALIAVIREFLGKPSHL